MNNKYKLSDGLAGFATMREESAEKEVSADGILMVCNSLKWRMEDCVEALVNISKKKDQAEEPDKSKNFSKCAEKSNQIEDNQSLRIYSNDAETVKQNLFNMNPGNIPLGAVPKYTFRSTNFLNRNHGNRTINRLNLNSKAFSLRRSPFNKKKVDNRNESLDPILKKIRQGFKIMILMRGAPGCGKSYLAREIVDETIENGDHRNHIFSTDDYFNDCNGDFLYRPFDLTVAHDVNQKRASQRALDGWSPIIIDNTNIKIWEMFAYVKIAVEYGYLIEIVEPKTNWSKSVGKLAIKNRHGVPKEKIQRMLDSFEKVTVPQLLRMSNCQYSMQVPQLRLLPPITSQLSTLENISLNTTVITDTVDINQQSKYGVFPNMNDELLENNNGHENDGILVDNAINWKSYEKESLEYWQQNQLEGDHGNIVQNIPKPQRRSSVFLTREMFSENAAEHRECTECKKENEEKNVGKSEQKFSSGSEDALDSNFCAIENLPSEILARHDTGCENENKLFSMLRQIYPNKQVDGLWDLFEKCQGDIDWAIDILLKDDSCVDQCTDILPVNTLLCNCNLNENEGDYRDSDNIQKNSYSSKKPRVKRDKMYKSSNHMEEIESQFVLGDQYYSEHMQKIRVWQPRTTNVFEHRYIDEVQEYHKTEKRTDEREVDCVTPDSEGDICEIVLGETLVEQLCDIFELNVIPKNVIKDLKTNVIIPKTLAYQLYLIWVECNYNQLEAHKCETLKEDAELARTLKMEQNYKDNIDVKNLSEQLAIHLYNTERNSWDSNTEDLASQLTKQNSSGEFSSVGPQTTVESLDSQKNSAVLQSALLDHRQIKSGETNKQGKELLKMSTDSNRLDFVMEKNLNSDQAKKMALHHFEVNRNEAVHHSQLKAECYQKAKDAIQKGNTSVAVYYSQIADLHKKKVENYNNTAANYIVAVHGFTQNNPDFIDLHYLHLVEAGQCLDIFIDKHIRKLKNTNRTYKYIFIITGRGLHSAGGVSIIKNKVKTRLKERNLKWSELNPGLLKVKLFSASKYANVL